MPKNTGSIGEIRKKIAETHEFISGAYHESGHTIYALLHLMEVNSVSIFKDKEINRVEGITHYHYITDIEDDDILNIFVRARLGVNYAGLIAEKALFESISGSSQTPMFISEGSIEDNSEARKIFKEYNLVEPGKKRAAYKRKLIRGVQNELYSNWDAVTIIAHALVRYHKLTFDDLKSLLTKKSINKQFWKEQFKIINIIYNRSYINKNNLRSFIIK